MLFVELARTSAAVAATRARSEKIGLLATCLGGLRAGRGLGRGDVPVGDDAANRRRLGVAPRPAAAGLVATLEILDVNATFERVASASGRGSQETRRRALEELFAQATEPEQRFLRGILHGELRQGALEGVMVEAVARAAEVPAADVRRALMLAGELPPVAGAAFARGPRGPRPVPPRGAPPRQADARADGRGRRDRDRPHRPCGSGVEAGRRAPAGAPPRQRGARVHEEPRGRHRPRAGGRRRGARAPRRRGGPRRGGDRPAAGRQAVSLPGLDEPVRQQRRHAGRCTAAAARAVLLRLSPSRRRRPSRTRVRGARDGPRRASYPTPCGSHAP